MIATFQSLIVVVAFAAAPPAPAPPPTTPTTPTTTTTTPTTTTTTQDTEKALESVRAAWKRTEDDVAKHRLKRATMSIGGGQNPREYEIHYADGVDADYERDPYAEPFHLRRVVVRETLPAVGDADVTYWFDEKGRVFFAFAHGAALAGEEAGFGQYPASEIRAWFDANEAPIRVKYNSVDYEHGALDKTLEITVDVAAASADDDARKRASKAAQVFVAHAHRLRDAVVAMSH